MRTLVFMILVTPQAATMLLAQPARRDSSSKAENAALSYFEFLEGRSWFTELPSDSRAELHFDRSGFPNNKHTPLSGVFYLRIGDDSYKDSLAFERQTQQLNCGNRLALAGDWPYQGSIEQISDNVWTIRLAGGMPGGLALPFLIRPVYKFGEWFTEKENELVKAKCTVRITRIDQNTMKEEVLAIDVDEFEIKPSVTVWKRE